MIQWVFERTRSAGSLSRIVIATDDERIRRAAESFGAEVWLTSPGHRSGTERVAEAAQKLQASCIINVQGDEPLVRGDMVDALVSALQDDGIPMATLAARTDDLSLLEEEGVVKVVTDVKGFALYFSRSPVPHGTTDFFWRHVGLYGYQRDFLMKLSRMAPSRLEKMERLEQLRVLENGFKIKVVETDAETWSVDYPQDIAKVASLLTKEQT